MSDKDICVFRGCTKPVFRYGACVDCQDMAAAVMRGAPVTCVHGVPVNVDCEECARMAEQKRRRDEVIVSVAKERGFSALEAAIQEVDVKLRELHRELLKRDVDSHLGPHGGAPVVTHLGHAAANGRVYAIRFEDGRYVVYWGSLFVASMAFPEDLTAYLIGVRVTSPRGH